MTTLLAVVVVVQIAALAYAGHQIGLQERARIEADDTHNECLHRIERRIGATHDAALLRLLADKWDSVEEQTNLTRLARAEYSPGGPSMPTIWLRQQAGMLEEEEEEES